MRGTDPDDHVHVTHRGEPAFLGLAFEATLADLDRLAAATDIAIESLDEPGGGSVVHLVDPDGRIVDVVAGIEPVAPIDVRRHAPLNVGVDRVRVDELQRVPIGASQVKRFGHAALKTASLAALAGWYADTLGLLASIDAHPRLVSFHAHSGPRRIESLVAALLEGHDVALVTDAGTPAISDPGTEVVAAARQAGIRVVPVAGPSAVATALSAAGLPGDRYLFLGFLPRKGMGRRRILERAAGEPWSVVFFEAPGRLVELLDDLITLCGSERQGAVARELTKLHEEIRGGTLRSLRTYYDMNPPLGEVTVVLAGQVADDATTIVFDPAEVSTAIAERLGAGDSRKDVVRMVCARFGLPRNEAYRLVMEVP
jgi:16S rRNA (cytidine1402-2'-O)-methyltransferase